MVDPAPRTVTSPGTVPPKRRRSRAGIFNLLLIIGVIAAVALFAWAEQQRRATESQLRQTEKELEEVKKSTQAGGEEVAKQVLEKVRAHIDIPADPTPTVATITDINRLREANEFYQPADNGDHLIITQKRAILYDPDRNIILDVVPVSIDPAAQTSPGASPASSPVVSPAAPVATPAL